MTELEDKPLSGIVWYTAEMWHLSTYQSSAGQYLFLDGRTLVFECYLAFTSVAG